MLDARFGHRLSDDIDVHLRTLRSFEPLRPARMGGEQLDRAMRNAGAHREHTSDHQIVYAFPEGRLDLIAGRLFPTPYGAQARIGAHVEEVAETTQILAAKIRARGRMPPARDLYDLAIAHQADPASAARALNALTASELDSAARAWKLHAAKIAEEAQRLRGVPPRYEHIARAPARYALNALRELVWPGISIHYTPEGARLEGTRMSEHAVLAEGITTEKQMTEALIAWGLYDDPIHLSHDVMIHTGKIEKALRGEPVAPECLKTLHQFPHAAEQHIAPTEIPQR